MRRALLIAALLAGAAGRALPGEVSGQVTRVSDGDTVWVRVENRAMLKLRLAGLDAPERCQRWGPAARAALTSRVLHRPVKIATQARDMHGRTIGTLAVDGEDVGAWLVEQGHAWNQRYRGRRGPYADQEQRARAARRGLFADAQAEAPRDFRRRHGLCPSGTPAKKSPG
ncbi:MAG: thermonuclease family protein [Piscinibacter sp.]|nr:thermonuclease family protein [Piscinibacter sp.]